MAGVKMRADQDPSERGRRNTVSDRFISPAMRCIWASTSSGGSMATASGLPAYGSSVKTS